MTPPDLDAIRDRLGSLATAADHLRDESDFYQADAVDQADADREALLSLVDTLRDALLAAEWGAEFKTDLDASGDPWHQTCSSCDAQRDVGGPGVHRPGCLVDAALTLCGLDSA